MENFNLRPSLIRLIDVFLLLLTFILSATSDIRSVKRNMEQITQDPGVTINWYEMHGKLSCIAR